MMPEYEKYTIEELYDVYENIDSNSYPERFEFVRKLIEKNKSKTNKIDSVSFKNASFKTIHTRLALDSTIFTFGTIELNGEKSFGYRLFCAGEGADSIECFTPLLGSELVSFIDDIRDLDANGFKKLIKMKTSECANVNFHFGGSNNDEEIKIKTCFAEMRTYNGFRFFSSYIKKNKLDALVTNLELCL